MKKEWLKVHSHNGYDIKVLNGAGTGDEFGYKVDCPELSEQTYETIAAAIDAINEMKLKKTVDVLYEEFEWQVNNSAGARPNIYILDGEIEFDPNSPSHGQSQAVATGAAEVIFSYDDWQEAYYDDVDTEKARKQAMIRAIKERQ